MKMSDVFELPVSPDPGAVWYGHEGAETTRAEFERATAHAINCHDDLVAALEAVLWMAEEWFEHGGDETTLADDYRAELGKANSAIAKARGEAP